MIARSWRGVARIGAADDYIRHLNRAALSDTEPVEAVVARSSADEWEKIIPYDRNSES